MKWVLLYLGVVFSLMPIMTTLLSANDKSTHESKNKYENKPPYPKKEMRILFFVGLTLLFIAFILAVK